MAVRALPEQLGAAIAAADADVRVEIEDGIARELDVTRDERRRQAERRQRLPDRLMQRQRVRVDDERVEEQLQRVRMLPLPGA